MRRLGNNKDNIKERMLSYCCKKRGKSIAGYPKLYWKKEVKLIILTAVSGKEWIKQIENITLKIKHK